MRTNEHFQFIDRRTIEERMDGVAQRHQQVVIHTVDSRHERRIEKPVLDCHAARRKRVRRERQPPAQFADDAVARFARIGGGDDALLERLRFVLGVAEDRVLLDRLSRVGDEAQPHVNAGPHQFARQPRGLHQVDARVFPTVH